MTKPKAAARTLGVVDQTLFNWAPCPPNTASRLDEPSWQLLGQRLHGQRFESRRQAKDEVVAWMLWYKRSRLHSTLADVSPMQFGANWLDGQPRQASASSSCGIRNPGARSMPTCPRSPDSLFVFPLVQRFRLSAPTPKNVLGPVQAFISSCSLGTRQDGGQRAQLTSLRGHRRVHTLDGQLHPSPQMLQCRPGHRRTSARPQCKGIRRCRKKHPVSPMANNRSVLGSGTGDTAKVTEEKLDASPPIDVWASLESSRLNM